jgi:alpha-tubulin suppressor-like RCC1 family protein
LLSKPIAKIAAGWNHTLALTERGDLFACGYGQYGQLGIAMETEVMS